MIRALLDANVVVSGLAGADVPTSTPGELIRRWRRRDFGLVVSHRLLGEIARTLANDYFRQRLSAVDTAAAIHLLRDKAELTAITVSVSGVATHPEDDLVLAAAASAHSDYLVTGDRKLQRLRQFQGVTILAPRDFLALLERAQTIPEE